jgi:hypothetical protein
VSADKHPPSQEWFDRQFIRRDEHAAEVRRLTAENEALRAVVARGLVSPIARSAGGAEVSDLRMDAYYYGFTPTGVIAIDRILSAVACAGKALHSTEDWTNEVPSDYGFGEGLTPAGWIQKAADEAAHPSQPQQAGVTMTAENTPRILLRFEDNKPILSDLKDGTEYVRGDIAQPSHPQQAAVVDNKPASDDTQSPLSIIGAQAGDA